MFNNMNVGLLMNISSLKCKRVRESCVSATPDYYKQISQLS